jgi:hypothetical protein
MNGRTWLSLLAATSSSDALDADSIVAYRLSRYELFDDPRILTAALFVVALAAVALVVWVYRRESRSLPRGAASALGLLRMIALVGLAIFYLGPLKRNDQQLTEPSRVVVMVDASQSMAVEDEQDSAGTARSRSDSVAAALRDVRFLDELRKRHNVSVVAFDATVRRLGLDAEEKPDEAAETEKDWRERMAPQGPETRLGEALREVLGGPGAGPLAGIVLMSDGGQTGGPDPLEQAASAAVARVPILTVGVGSSAPRRNVRIQELVAPPRAFPRDKIQVRALVHGEGFRGRSVEIELYSSELASTGAGEKAAAALRLGSQRVAFDHDRQTVTAEFDVEPAAPGALQLEARLAPLADDQYSEDNQASAEIDVVETGTRVLLLAGGPTRDYRFLRGQLRRDPHVVVDVLLQGAATGISQDAAKILSDFPRTRDELFLYDAIVAFDPDWTLLDAAQVDLLEEWVAREAGGLIAVAGPIHMAPWIQSPEHAKLRALYPVEFQARLTLLDDGLFGSKTPWPLELTREGLSADFLWLGDGPEESRDNWQRFPGVFGCYATKGAKPGATVYARYSDPDAGLGVERPVYLADQFYGAGRVMYLGSGELWRLRSVDPGFFERLTTQLLRHVSEGRLLRGSSRGRLLVERDRCFVGDTVVVRAQLTSANRDPYVAPTATARVTGPGDWQTNIDLRADPNRPGNYIGQLIVPKEGAFRIVLSVPDAPDEVLSKRITATVPDLEFNDTRRNESLLAALAHRTGGRYYSGVRNALEGGSDLPPVAEAIPSKSETRIVRGKPDEQFTVRINKALLATICGALCCEWLCRRLLKLA